MANRARFKFFTCFLSILIVSVSCAQAPSAAPTSAAPTTAAKTVTGTTPAPSAASPTTAAKPGASPAAAAWTQLQAPKYGGTLTSIVSVDPTNFDSGTKGQGGYGTGGPQYQQYMGTNWLLGPAGGGPADYFLTQRSVEDLYGPIVAESWKMPSQGVWVLQIRKGMHWQKVDSDAGRLMGGREVTADDVAASLKRLLTAPQSWAAISQPKMAQATTVEKTGDWEVTIKTPVDYLTSFFWIISGGGFNTLYPPEVVAKYGDMSDWHNAVGTGAYMLTDFTKGASLTYTKNPDYWETDPAGPGKGNKLPYIDTYKILVVPDASTRLASFRTAKIDVLTGVTKEDAGPILKDNPQMPNFRYMSGCCDINSSYSIAMPVNKENLPFKDKRVRQAMMLATDFNGLSQTLFGGDAEIDMYPVNKQITALYSPLSEMPQSTQDLFKYNPDKAKQLLADAGYPNGFKTKVTVLNDPQLVDELSVFKGMWAKVGIDLAIDPRENAAFQTILNSRTNDELIYRFQYTTMPIVLYLSPYRGTSSNNPSFIDEPTGTVPEIEAVNDEVNKNVFTNWSAAYGAYKKLKPILLENAYSIPRPAPYVYNMWWPWVKNYFGNSIPSTFLRYAFIDQDMKKAMGH